MSNLTTVIFFRWVGSTTNQISLDLLLFGDFVADATVNHHHQMDVSENSGFSPQIIHETIGFSIYYTPSILGVFPLFLETPKSQTICKDCGELLPLQIYQPRIRLPWRSTLPNAPPRRPYVPWMLFFCW